MDPWGHVEDSHGTHGLFRWGNVGFRSEVCTHVSKLHLRFKDYEPMPASIVNGCLAPTNLELNACLVFPWDRKKRLKNKNTG